MRALICQKYPTEGGINLAADVFLPDGPGPFPIIVCRTPYNRVTHLANGAKYWLSKGYGFVATDCRGKFESEGEFTQPFVEAIDGKATIDWIANEKWCNGRIGLWGRSYGGCWQVPAAQWGHEAIRAICPSIVMIRAFNEWARYDGCLAQENLLWWMLTNASVRTTPPNWHIDYPSVRKMRTLDEIEAALGFSIQPLRDFAEHDQDGPFWEKRNQLPMHPKIRVPGLHSGGWFDHVSRGQFDGYQGIRDHGGTDAARKGQRLFIGPWGHISFLQNGDTHRRYGTWDFTKDADMPVLDYELRFFNLHLKDIDDGFGSEPPVRLFLMGENRWISVPDWPVPGAAAQRWHLDSNGSARGLGGGGVLRLDAPDRTAEDTITYDPADPVPTCGGQIFWNMEPRGPQDQRHLLDRADVLLYRSHVLDKPLRVIGDIELDVTIATDVDDTDIVAKLCVEEAGGSVTVIVLGSFRCRYRKGWDKRVPMEHDQPTPIHLHLSQLAYTFPAGSRIALMVTSSDYPRIQPHTNTMAKPWQPTEPRIAHTRVLHGRGVTAALTLPVVEQV